jgi:uncharacterized protein (TIGR03083 family)
MTDRAVTQAALEHCFDQIDALAADLSETEWGVQSLCPEWDVRGCMTHVVGVDDLLIGWRPQAQDDPPPFQKMAEFATETAALDAAAFAARGGETHAARRAELGELTDDQWAQPCMSPIGPATYGRFMEVRVFDYWVHERDMTIPLGRETDDSGAGAEIALDEVHGSIGYILGKKVGLPDGMSITFDLQGGIDRQIHAVVEGRAGLVDSLDNPDVTVSADTTTFIMLACGRIDPQEQIDAGKISWTGATEWGEKTARNLRFTM